MAGLYVHIPFCRQKCHYCNFYSLASQKFKDQVVESLLKEIELQKDYLDGEALKTIYFGGGTPSLLSISEISRIVQKAAEIPGIAANAEITLEANPDDLNREYLTELQKTPVNRLSIGIQSFDDNDLLFLNRRHNGKKANQAIRLAMDTGFQNLSCDLIYGIPGASDDTWIENIRKLIDLNIPHISTYALTVETGTALDHLIKKGMYSPVDEEQSILQFSMLMELMEKNGYEHYEISNFCLPGKISKHNSAYWTGEKYLGIGPSAHSFDGNSRQWNVSNIKAYVDSVSNGTLSFEKEVLSDDQKFNEFVLTSLRTMWGVDLHKMKADFGIKYYNHFILNLKPMTEKGQLILSDEKAMLSRQGKFFADQVASELFCV
jgi:oxygen-independent coproporphyrinogen-3 oxidase